MHSVTITVCLLFFARPSLHSIAVWWPFEKRTGRVASYDDRNILHDGPSRKLDHIPVYAQGRIHAVPVMARAIVWWPHRWFFPCVRDSEEQLGLVLQHEPLLLPLAITHMNVVA